MRLFENHSLGNCYIVMLALLISALIHRNILKTFGLWKTSKSNKFDTTFFTVVETDIKTSQILKHHHKLRVKDDEPADGGTAIQCSEEFLIAEDSDMSLHRHELTHLIDQDQQMLLRSRFRKRNEIVTATTRVNENDHGVQRLRIEQDEVDILLEPLQGKNDDDFDIDFTSTVVIEKTPIEFNPTSLQFKLLLMTLKKYFFGDLNFKNIFETRPKLQRTQYDVYKFTFLCEILNFFVLLFGFTEFNVSMENSIDFTCC